MAFRVRGDHEFVNFPVVMTGEGTRPALRPYGSKRASALLAALSYSLYDTPWERATRIA